MVGSDRRLTVPVELWDFAKVLAHGMPFSPAEIATAALSDGLRSMLDYRAEQAKMRPEEYLAWRKSEWLRVNFGMGQDPLPLGGGIRESFESRPLRRRRRHTWLSEEVQEGKPSGG